MTYVWGCAGCRDAVPDKGWRYKVQVEVARTMSGSQDPPWHPCPTCGGHDWVRQVERPQFTARSEKDPWPMRLSNIEKIVPVKDAKGNVIGSRRENIVANSKSEYFEILAKRDLVMYAEGEDSTVNVDSQHSAWGQSESAAPTENAQRMYEGMKFLGADEVGTLKFEERSRP